MRLPDAPTPLGCVVGFLALIPGALSALLFLASSKAFAREPQLTELGETLRLWGIVALVPAVLGVAISGVLVARSTGRCY